MVTLVCSQWPKTPFKIKLPIDDHQHPPIPFTVQFQLCVFCFVCYYTFVTFSVTNSTNETRLNTFFNVITLWLRLFWDFQLFLLFCDFSDFWKRTLLDLAILSENSKKKIMIIFYSHLLISKSFKIIRWSLNNTERIHEPNLNVFRA